MAIIQVKDATGSVLDWMVAKCEGTLGYYVQPNEKRGTTEWKVIPQTRRYSTNWTQGGPIIEGERIAAWFHTDYGCWCAAGIDWMNADVLSDTFMEMPDAYRGPTPLIAAMRCYVASKLGEEVEVPDGIT
jgi:hypothetical protein